MEILLAPFSALWNYVHQFCMGDEEVNVVLLNH